jgi:hypothetical protein
MEQNAYLLHLAVETSASNAGDLHFGVQQVSGRVCVIAIEKCLDGTALGEQLLVISGELGLSWLTCFSKSAARTTAWTVTNLQSNRLWINSSKLAGTGMGTAPWRSRVILSLRTLVLKSACDFPCTRIRSPGTRLGAVAAHI